MLEASAIFGLSKIYGSPRRIPVAAGGDSGWGPAELSSEDATEIRRKRLYFQSAHRGTKESDLLLGAFADAHLAAFTVAQLDAYEALLNENDGDIYDWVTGRCAPPPKMMSDVLRLLLDFKYPGAR
jgi:antitoxin CptB